MDVSGWSVGNATSWISNHADILSNVANTLVPVQRLLTGAAYLIGLTFAFKAIYTLKVYGEARTMMSNSASIKEPVFYLIVAAVFVYFPTGYELVKNTAFGPDSNVLAYVNTQNSALNTFLGPDSMVGTQLALIIQTIGLISFIRGWVLIARSAGQGQQPGGTGKGLIHIFGGVLAMNIVGTLQIINNTIYGS